MFENFIKMRENAAAHKKDLEEAEKNGYDFVEIENEDYQDFSDFIAEEKERDEDESEKFA